MKFGPANSNWKGGSYSSWTAPDDPIKLSIRRHNLRKVLTAEIDHRTGKLPYTNEEAMWAMRIVREQPEWAIPVLNELDFKPESEESHADT